MCTSVIIINKTFYVADGVHVWFCSLSFEWRQRRHAFREKFIYYPIPGFHITISACFMHFPKKKNLVLGKARCVCVCILHICLENGWQGCDRSLVVRLCKRRSWFYKNADDGSDWGEWCNEKAMKIFYKFSFLIVFFWAFYFLAACTAGGYPFTECVP